MTEHITAGHIIGLIVDWVVAVVVVGCMIWGFIRVLKKSEDRSALIFKWVLTVVVVSLMIIVIGPLMRQGGYAAAFGGIPLAAVGGLILAITWRGSIAGMIAKPFGDLYDGGDAEYEPRPVYSHAIAARKRGDHEGALALIRQQLERFPTDIEGQLLVADIQAENLHDLPSAAMTIERICNQPEHTPRNIAMCLNMLADWYLKFYQDRDTARETLQRIIERFPDSEMSNLAAQRIGSLASAEHLQAAHDRRKFTVVEGVKNLGLLDPKLHPAPADPDAVKEAAELVTHLQAHPLDAEAREKLAIIYADHYQRMDLATDQLEQLIAHPNQPQKRVAHWLNLLADLQIRRGANYDTVRATLQRIVDLFPGAPIADVAANRLSILKLQLKGREKVADVKLGTYEQDIGLKK